jgi:hypothetical protein
MNAAAKTSATVVPQAGYCQPVGSNLPTDQPDHRHGDQEPVKGRHAGRYDTGQDLLAVSLSRIRRSSGGRAA